MLIKALAKVVKIPKKEVKEAMIAKGDLGIVAEELLKGMERKETSLTFATVFEAFKTLGFTTGKDSMKLKEEQIIGVLN